MQKTVEMIEGVIRHLNEVLANPKSTPEMRRAAQSLLENLKTDLAIAKSSIRPN